MRVSYKLYGLVLSGVLCLLVISFILAGLYSETVQYSKITSSLHYMRGELQSNIPVLENRSASIIDRQKQLSEIAVIRTQFEAIQQELPVKLSGNSLQVKENLDRFISVYTTLLNPNPAISEADTSVKGDRENHVNSGKMLIDSVYKLANQMDKHASREQGELSINQLLLTILVAAVFVLLSVIISCSILRPPKNLQTHIRRKQNGEEQDTAAAHGTSEPGMSANKTKGLFQSNSELKHEIEERKSSEAKAKKSMYELNRILNSMQDTVYRIDAEGRLVIASASVYQLLGYIPDEIVGMYISGFYAEHDGRDKFLAALKASGGQIQNYEATFRHKNGSIVWVLLSAHYLYDDEGEIVGIEGTTRDISKLKEAEDTTARLGRILDQSSNEIYIFDTVTLQFTQVSKGALSNLGYSEEEMKSLTAVDIKPELDFDKFNMLVEPLKNGSKDIVTFDAVHKRKNGTTYPVEVRLQLFSNESPPVFVAIILDISDRKLLETQTRQLSSALAQTADSVMITDASGIVQYVNQAFEEMSGFSKEEVIGKTPNIARSGRQDRAFYKKMWACISSGEVFQDVLVNRRKDGTYYYEEKTITPLKDSSGKIINYVSTGKDISERMQAQEHLQFLAHHDPLTELPNRAMFTERIQHAIELSQRNNSNIAVLFLDIDRFKVINDSLGHDVGDCLLQNLAKRLSDCMRDGDTIARLGGDEFIILLEAIDDSSDIVRVARGILEAFTSPVYLENHELFITTSIGISVFPEDGTNANVLIKNADTAMYRAKDRGRNTYQFYSADMSTRAFERLTLESGLRRALEREEFILYYQPQLESSTGRVVGLEALIRWQHPELGLVSPADFIPLLEETGMIVPVGKWILETACNQNKSWQDEGFSDLCISVNLSVRQFYEKDMVKNIEHILKDSGLDPEFLDLEITESVIMKSADATIETMNDLSDLGVQLAIDDFGTGYSSLAYLKRFPINRLKVDQAFVRDITTDPDDAAIVSTIVSMAHNLNMGVIAEGVETEEQASFLREVHCEVMQGYLFGRPMPTTDMTKYLHNEMARLKKGGARKNRA